MTAECRLPAEPLRVLRHWPASSSEWLQGVPICSAEVARLHACSGDVVGMEGAELGHVAEASCGQCPCEHGVDEFASRMCARTRWVSRAEVRSRCLKVHRVKSRFFPHLKLHAKLQASGAPNGGPLACWRCKHAEGVVPRSQAKGIRSGTDWRTSLGGTSARPVPCDPMRPAPFLPRLTVPYSRLLRFPLNRSSRITPCHELSWL